MKIALIGNGFEKNIGQGIEKYCGYLAEGIATEENKLEKIKLSLYKNPFATLFESFGGNFFKTIGKKADIYHFTVPEMAFPCIFKRPSVVTVYDVIPFVLTNERKKSYNFYFKIAMEFVKKADRLIAISKSTKRDLIKYLKIPGEKISLIYVDHKIFFPTKKKKNKKFTVGFLGGLVKRKNTKILLDVADILRDQNIFFKIGGKGAGLEELKKMKENKKLKNVEFLGFIPDKNLNNFYNSLDLFIAPTTYDGFCMPGLEAMACGCPILVSNTGALPEVAGNAGITVNPNNSIEITRAILNVKNNPYLKKKMSENGIRHAQKFSWEKCVKKTLKVYKKLKMNYPYRE